MDEVKNRLIEYVHSLNISRRKFADRVDVSPNILSTKSALGTNILIKISNNFPELNIDWVVTGRGEMLCKVPAKANRPNAALEPQDSLPGVFSDDGETYIKNVAVDILPLFNRQPNTEIKLQQDDYNKLARQLPVTNYVFMQAMLAEQAEAKAAQMGISIEAAKELIYAKVNEAAGALREKQAQDGEG